MVGLVFLVPQTPLGLIDAVTSLGSWFWPVLLLVVGLAVLVPVFVTRSADDEETTPQVRVRETTSVRAFPSAGSLGRQGVWSPTRGTRGG